MAERTDVTWGQRRAGFWLMDGPAAFQIEVNDCSRETTPDAARVLCERLAALLTADDEAREREAMRAGLPIHPSPPASSAALFDAYANLICALDFDYPIDQCRAALAAYRAAVDQG